MARSSHSPLPSSISSPESTSTSMTSPEPTAAEDDDIWDDEASDSQAHPEALSDLPSMRRQHMTDGYREGLSVGKAKVMQQGFDAGYPVGIKIGLRVGKILGVLEGIVACKPVTMDSSMNELAQKTLARARHELSMPNLLKEVSEESLSSINVVPETVDVIIERWETAIFGTQQAREP